MGADADATVFVVVDDSMRARVVVDISSMYEHDEHRLAHLARAHGSSQYASTSMVVMCSSVVRAHNGCADSMCVHVCVRKGSPMSMQNVGQHGPPNVGIALSAVMNTAVSARQKRSTHYRRTVTCTLVVTAQHNHPSQSSAIKHVINSYRYDYHCSLYY